MPLAPATLPILLAGPVLRRVESDLVCVWIATSRPCHVSLLLFDGGDIVASPSEHDDLRAGWVSHAQPALQAGAHLHVLAVTLDLRRPDGNALRSSGTLEPDHTYSYDLRFDFGGDSALNLRTLGLLN